ncbi:Putative extracellular Invasin/intimin cell-adhesion protein [Vibrio harveyi]|uniref:Ig-like domain-containing protein n=1 Tax=Vibrio harveyi TaxID=669 RepID=UPI002AD9F8AC|nr:Ig-like domain-containing protein [Vibrio harveyi]CAK6712236.1 Putative extracellular Invasin/intimin cell-adhesion protein [Vibrio harveyi]
MTLNSKVIAYFLPLVIIGCGGESAQEEKQSSHQEIVDAPAASDSFFQFSIDDSKHVVSLHEHVVDPQGLPLTLESVEPLSAGCDSPVVDKENLSFLVDGSTPKTCAYRYVVKNHPPSPELEKESTADSIVLLSDETESSLLPPLSKATEVDSEIGIDLRQEPNMTFPSGYTLEEDIVVLGEGSASADIVTNTIYYQASSISGNTRLVYTLSSDDGNNVKMGYVDIAVSSKGNGMPIANNIAGPESLLPNSVITIDVIDAISDPDGDPLQLTDVYAYNANVAVTDPLDVHNTKFNFSASKPGVYNVTYYVSDHRGGFAVAIVRIVVSEPPLPWSDIVITNGEHYTAPWEQRAADASKVFYQGVQNEVIDGTNYSLALFDHATAEALCLSRGMLLPTSEQLTNLYDEKPYIDVTDHWPVTISYWASSREPSSTHQAMDIRTGQFISLASATPLIVTCVYPGELLVEVSKDNAYQTNSFDGDYNIVEAYVKDANGAAMSDQHVYVFSDEDNLRFEEQHKPTDQSGKASFKVRSSFSGEFEVLVNYYSQTLSKVVTFVEDILEKITISGQKTLLMGETITLKAIGTYQSGGSEDVTNQSTWQSSENSIVSVNQQGEANALKAGSAIVSASLSGIHSNDFQITVKPVLTKLIVRPDLLDIKVGDSKQLGATAHYSDNSVQVVTALVEWGSSDSSIATVDSNGLVKGKVEGTVTIHASFKDGEVTQKATVYPVNVFTNKLRISPTSANVLPGERQKFTLEYLNDNHTWVDVKNSATWYNSGKTYSNTKGSVIGAGTGSGSVEATYNGLSVTASIKSSGIPPLHGPANWDDAMDICKNYNGVHRVFSGNKSVSGLTHNGITVHSHENKHLWTDWGNIKGEIVTAIEDGGRWVIGPFYPRKTRLYFHCFGEDEEEER